MIEVGMGSESWGAQGIKQSSSPLLLRMREQLSFVAHLRKKLFALWKQAKHLEWAYQPVARLAER